jgi:tRNA(fMet)-specific endonuclease VapC
MDAALLDTDMLNEVLKQKNVNVIRHAAAYLTQQGQFAISSITWYEILRGLKEKNATSQLVRFEAFCRNTQILPVLDEILEQTADLWVSGRSQGMAPNDADLIIAATALHHNRILVTGNTAHFGWIQALKLENWRKP